MTLIVITGCSEGTSGEIQVSSPIAHTPSSSTGDETAAPSQATANPTPTSASADSTPNPAHSPSSSPQATIAITPEPDEAVEPTSTPSITPEVTASSLPSSPEPEIAPPEEEQDSDSHFGFMPAFYDYADAREAGAAWDRPHFEHFTWGWLEPEPGVFHFSEIDRLVQGAQQYGFHILANVQPRADWDLAKCRTVPPSMYPMAPPFTDAYKPCDMTRYRAFVTALVERYDGDGVDDMPGLVIPIKHWEIMNEPEFEMYFRGTPEDYFDILVATAEAAKEADPEAMIVQGGMAGMMPECTDFWQEVFDLGGADYIDIFNMHSIGHGEHLNIPAFKEFLTKNDLDDRPIWVTEVQYQQSWETENFTDEDFAAVMARSYIFALANGVDKLFYVNLINAGFDPGAPFDERSALIDDDWERTPLFFAHRMIVDMLGDLGPDDSVEIIEEKIGSWSIEQGQYKFVIGGRTIYALWGTGPPPAEIKGLVRVTDISGGQRTVDADTISLCDSPIFVEPEAP